MRAILLSALALGGCASTATVIDSTPVEVVRSSKSAEAVVFCLQNKTGAPAANLNGSQVVVHKGAFGGSIASYSVRPDGAGSVIEIRKGTAVQAPKWTDCY